MRTIPKRISQPFMMIMINVVICWKTHQPDVFTRLGSFLTPNMNAKRFKADTSHNSLRSHGWECSGIRPSLVKIEPNIGRETRQPTKFSLRTNREAVKIGVELVRALSQQALSRIIPQNKRAKARVVLQPTNKIGRTTTISRRQAK